MGYPDQEFDLNTEVPFGWKFQIGTNKNISVRIGFFGKSCWTRFFKLSALSAAQFLCKD